MIRIEKRNKGFNCTAIKWAPVDEGRILAPFCVYMYIWFIHREFLTDPSNFQMEELPLNISFNKIHVVHFLFLFLVFHLFKHLASWVDNWSLGTVHQAIEITANYLVWSWGLSTLKFELSLKLHFTLTLLCCSTEMCHISAPMQTWQGNLPRKSPADSIKECSLFVITDREGW